MNEVNIPLKVSTDGEYNLKADGGGSISVGVDTTITAAINEHYSGPYVAVPSSEPQTLPTNGMVMDDDISIGAIPSNYGLITWNGSILTVS